MKKVLDRVVKLLTDNADLRDDVVETRKKIWEEDLMNIEKSIYFIYASELLELEQNGSITNSETIRRMWQLAQHDNVALQGKKYDIRHRKKKHEVKAEIKELSKQHQTA